MDINNIDYSDYENMGDLPLSHAIEWDPYIDEIAFEMTTDDLFKDTQ